MSLLNINYCLYFQVLKSQLLNICKILVAPELTNVTRNYENILED